MLRRPLYRSVLPILGLIIGGIAAGCDSAPTAVPQLEPSEAPLLSQAAQTARGTFTFFPPPLPVNAPCVDEDAPLRMLGSWSGWFTQTLTANGHLHITEHIDWSDVTIVAADGRSWLPGPGAHESFSLNFEATDAGFVQRQIMHNLRARFESQDGEADLQVWHTIHIVRGPAPDYEIRVFDVVFPFQARCLGT